MRIEERVSQGLEVAVVLAAVATIPLTVLTEESISSQVLATADWLVWAIFALDYFFGLGVSAKRLRYVRANWLGLAIVIFSFPLMPALLDVVRLARLARLTRIGRISVVIARGIGGARQVLGRRGLPYVLAVIAFLVAAGGTLLALVEPERAPGGFWDGVWWAVVTVTTVGYGDIAPATLAGRLIATVLMLTGIGLTATLAACIAAYFIDQEQGSDIRALTERLDRIESLLGALVENRDRGQAADHVADAPAGDRAL